MSKGKKYLIEVQEGVLLLIDFSREEEPKQLSARAQVAKKRATKKEASKRTRRGGKRELRKVLEKMREFSLPLSAVGAMLPTAATIVASLHNVEYPIYEVSAYRFQHPKCDVAIVRRDQLSVGLFCMRYQ